jgi:hypothetical protein
VEALKKCASASDAFLYQFSSRALSELGLFEDIPFYQPTIALETSATFHSGDLL